MDKKKDIIEELRHAEKMGLFESHAQMTDTDTDIDTENNKEKDEFHSTGFLHRDSPYFGNDTLDIDMIFLSVPLPMVFKNYEGVYTVVNELFCELIGKNKEKIIGKTDFELFSEKRAKRFVDDDARVLANDKSENQIEKFSDSKEKWIRVSRNPVVNQGKVVGLICSFMDVTSEKELIASEKKFKLIFENAPDGIYLNDSEGRFVDGNKKAEEIIGYHKGELIGKKFSDIALLKKRDIPKALKNLALNKLGRKTGPSEFELIRKDGSTVKLEISNFPFKLDGKQMALGIARDITLRKRAEQILKDHQIELEQIFEAMPEALVYADTNRKIIRVNSAFEKIYGYKREEVIGKKTKILYANPNEFVEQGEKRFNVDARNKMEPYGIDYRRKNGEIFPSETVGTPVRDAQDEVIGMLGLVRDITERKKAEKQLDEKREQLELALNGGELGTWDWNIKTDRVVFNDRWAEMKGYQKDEIEPHLSSWSNLVHPNDMPLVKKKLNNHLEGKTDSYEAEFRMRHKSGEWIWILDKGKVIERDEQGNPLRACGTHLDITGRKNAEKQISERQELLKKGEKLANMGSWQWDVKTGIVVCSDQWQRIHGTQKSEYQKEELIQIAHPDDRQKVMEALDNIVTEQRPYDIEHRIIKQDDKKIHLIKAYGELVKDQEGNFSKIKGYARDITDEKQAMKQLEKSYDIINKSPVVAFTWRNEQDWPVEYVSENVKNLFGYVKKDFLDGSIKFSKTIHPDDVEHVAAEVKRYSENRNCKEFDQEYRIVTSDGRVKWVYDKTMVRRDNQGKALFFDGIILDITADKHSEEELKEKIDELQRWKKLTVGRELKMSMLKEKIRKLEKEISKKK